jgi:Ca-activated chloride channel family protein
MRFGSADYFWLLTLIPVLVAFFIWVWQHKQRVLARFASPALARRLTPTVSLARQVYKWVLLVLACIFLIFALVRPQFGIKTEMVERKGVDIMVALDISQSMLAQDIAPSRIERAKHEIGKLIDLLKGDRVGIIVFAGESYVQCPLTLDYAAAHLFLDAVDTDWIQLQGTAIADAIAQSLRAFRSESRKHKVLILISDGEDHEGDAMKAAQEAAQAGAKVYTIGIGSESGVPIPMNRGSGTVVYKKDRFGNLVMTRLNPITLEKVALEGGGKYFHAGTNLDLSRIYGEIAAMEQKELGASKMAIYKERYQYLLAVALLLLVVEFFLPARIRPRMLWKGRFD